MDPIFLHELDLLTLRPNPTMPGSGYLGGPGVGKTDIKMTLSFQTFDRVIDKYRVSGQAAIYLADVQRQHIRNEINENPLEEKMVFDGYLQVFGPREVFEQREHPYAENMSRRIWCATKPPVDLAGQYLLEHMVLGHSDELSRVEAIIEGYSLQKKEAEEQAAFNNSLRLRRTRQSRLDFKTTGMGGGSGTGSI